MASSLTGLSTSFKALKINEDSKIYGSFAEIGAGQEVARYFFQAGQASGTVAKSMSAYDMAFSDEIYGKEESGRYVCESRLKKMLQKEYQLLDDRLSSNRGSESTFFSFANTVATNRKHGWLGLRYQSRPSGPHNDIILHVKMLDNTRLQQTEALGILGVNLIYAAFHLSDQPESFIQSLKDNLSHGRIEIDLIKFEGPDFKEIDNRLMCLELVQQGLSHNVVFNEKGETSIVAEEFFNKSVFVLRGQFRPVTKTNIEILNLALDQFQKDYNLASTPEALLEITMAHLQRSGDNIDKKDFLDRVDTLAHLGYKVMISNFDFYYEMKQEIRKVTPEPIGVVIGGDHLDYFFEKTNYQHLTSDLFEASSKLFDDKVTVYIFPYKTAETCTSLKSYMTDETTQSLINFLIKRSNLKELRDCDEIESSFLSSYVRELLKKKDPKWKSLVPQEVCSLIEEKGLFQ